MKRCPLFFLIVGAFFLHYPATVAQTITERLQPDSVTGRASAANMHPECAMSDHGASCEDHAGKFTAATAQNGQGHRTLVFHDLQTSGPSINLGNAGGWTVTHVIEAPHIVFGTRGIDQYEGVNITKNGVGDLAGVYLYVYGGGRAAQSDEGVTGITVESGEINGYFHGTIAGGAGQGATSLSLTDTPKAPHDWASTCDGCMLLDISKGTIAGSLNGKSIPFGSTYLNQLPTTAVTISGAPASLPLTHAWCSALSAIPQSTTAGAGTSRTFNCTLGRIGSSTPAFSAGGVVTIAGKFYPEQATLTAVGQPSGGVQSLTVLARNPNPIGSLIFQGGIAGQSLSFDDNLAATGFRSSYYVFGSTDGVHLIYGDQVAGSLAAGNTGYVLPRPFSEAETTSSGFHLYPSAEIVANTAKPSAPLLEPNTVAWQAGDLVENPRFQSFGGFGIRDHCQQFTPSDGSSGCMLVASQGTGISGSYTLFRLRNGTDYKLYRQGGGVLEPIPAIKLEGTFGHLIQARSGPSKSSAGASSVIDIQATVGNDTTPFNLFTLPSARSTGAAQVTYDPATLRVGFPQGITASFLGTTQNCSGGSGRANCGQASSGSFVLPAGTDSVTVTTAAVTQDSQIQITPDASLDARLGVTCNKNPASAFAPYGIIARTPGHSFTLSVAGGAAANGPNCYSFTIIN